MALMIVTFIALRNSMLDVYECRRWHNAASENDMLGWHIVHTHICIMSSMHLIFKGFRTAMAYIDDCCR